ncbi:MULTISPECIES: amidohydrolase family protein [unclassified Streptomyces]|uniref:amidohydrolase family protein n=1 Tax=unclassified Streptomyces TaxID=2593676 RepID=UPI001BEB2323|nr:MULTISPECIES: amidohydrolase family protein [unclassified Streptomyces]MBT2405859.1 amidohydrolase [Streptomyces sp. ISL-21]MBT2456475.1 amidohydrolase [Streptomyces sp. ISL-86]MBT2613024.1 amidohydrolase [Streptomyces sp. ISL-87]
MSSAESAYEDPYLIISSDCHAGLPTERYRPYLDSRFHPQFDEFLGQRDARREEATRLGVRNEAFAEKWFHDHEEGLKGGWDTTQRLKELDGDGVAAEVVFPDADAVDSQTAAPFGVGLGLSGDQDPELGMAGAQAHNRWLAEFVSQNPERHCGVALLPITGEPREVVAEIHRAKESGLGALMIPSMWVDKAPYHDRRYDPVWAAAAETAMPIVTHSGAAPRHEYGDHLGIYVSEVTWWPSRPLWFLLWSGVFERHPGLKFGVAESGCWWLPNQLWFMDRLYLGAHGGKKLSPFAELKRPPSEYLDRQVFICATNTKRRELAQRYEIGVDNILWGSDFPHPEGTWPHTRNWLKNTFHDIPVGETRRMLGLAAAEVFGFDTAKLAPVAARIGPTPAELGQSPDQAAVEASWARSREVGRHWLTDNDFPVLGVSS